MRRRPGRGRLRKVGLAALAGLFQAWAGVAGTAPGVALRVVPEEPEVGRAFHLELEVRVPREAVVELPGRRAPLAPFRILDYTLTREEGDGGQILLGRYELLALTAGEREIGPLRVRRRLEGGETDSLQAGPVRFRVRSLLAELDPPTQDILPIKGPLPPPQASEPLPWWPTAAGGLALLALLTLGVWWRRRRKLGPPPEPAHVVALRRIEELRQLEPASPEELEAFYVRLSEVLRRYLQARFDVRAMELTTLEIKRSFLPGVHGARWTLQLHRLLDRMDLVKFARFRLPPSGAMEDLDAVRCLVEELVQRDREAERQARAGAVVGEGEEAS